MSRAALIPIAISLALVGLAWVLFGPDDKPLQQGATPSDAEASRIDAATARRGSEWTSTQADAEEGKDAEAGAADWAGSFDPASADESGLAGSEADGGGAPVDPRADAIERGFRFSSQVPPEIQAAIDTPHNEMIEPYREVLDAAFARQPERDPALDKALEESRYLEISPELARAVREAPNLEMPPALLRDSDGSGDGRNAADTE